MEQVKKNIHDELKKIFHEPKRMAIMSALCVAEHGMAFTELKKECELTDGNLNRHLKVLIEADAVEMKKEFIGVKPRTTVFITANGIESFTAYLNALQQVLEQALQAMPKKSEKDVPSVVNFTKVPL